MKIQINKPEPVKPVVEETPQGTYTGKLVEVEEVDENTHNLTFELDTPPKPIIHKVQLRVPNKPIPQPAKQQKLSLPQLGKQVSLPDKQVQPNMHELKKPIGSGENLTHKLHIAGLGKPVVKNPEPKKQSSRGLLFGSGLTKRVAEQQQKQLDKSFDKELGKKPIDFEEPIEGEVLPKEEEFHLGELPTTLVPDSLQLDEYQTEALKLRDEMYGVLIGAAGTGKTTTLKFLIAEIEDQVLHIKHSELSTAKESDKNNHDMLPAIAFCSFTGKAVQQMKRALPKKYHPLANTIHATLGYTPVTMDEETVLPDGTVEYRQVRRFVPTYTENYKLPYKIIMIDETGTVPVDLWHKLLAALTPDCRIFMIGDLNQLPPVTGHSVLGFAMLKWPTYTLEKLHRQAEGDPIAENAHRVLNGKRPLTDEVTKRFIVQRVDDGSMKARLEVLGIIRHLHQQGIFDPMRDALIVPQNISNIGQIELNRVLVEYFNPQRKDEHGNIVNKRTIITAGYEHPVFALGDKVMILANDNQRGLTNGMIGVVTKLVPNDRYKGERVAFAEGIVPDMHELDLTQLQVQLEMSTEDKSDDDPMQRAASHIMHIKFQNVDEEITFETAGEYKKIAHAYAMTCHKSQGSEYDTVVVLAHSANVRMLCREWLYTAITRAKKRVILLCNNRGIQHAIKVQKIKGNTIAEKAEKFLALTKADKNEEPAKLPEPRKITQIGVKMS